MADKKTHDQFVDELFIKNKYYREGKFIINGFYKSAWSKIEVTTEFGQCLAIPIVLLKGAMPNISSAKNKSEYFRRMCFKKFGEDGNDDLSQINYINNIIKIKIIDEFGEYWSSPSNYLGGKRSKDRQNINISISKRSDVVDVEHRIRMLHPNLEFNLDNFTTINKSIFVKNEYGICKVNIQHLLDGLSPCIMSSTNKTEYFKNKAREVHGDRYNYELVCYKSSDIKVKIISEHGIFEQTPRAHLSGQGCPEVNKENPLGWRHTAWKLKAEGSKHFKGYVVYFLECWDCKTGEKFYKIGRTFNSIYRRFAGKYNMPYQYNILYTIELDDPKRICELEQEYKNKHKEFKYLPKKGFGGMHECFSKIIYI